MSKSMGRLLGLAGLAVVFYFIVSLVANLSQLADAADRVYMGAGRPLFIVLAGIAFAALLAPLVYYLRLPRPLVPPADETGAEYTAYRERLAKVLMANPALRNVEWAGVEPAMAALNQRAEETIRAHARTVFIGTALMQSGRLDGLVVLTAQARMVWTIAGLFYVRPSPRQLLYLYSNVAASALVAQNLGDLDLGELTAPMVSAAAPSLMGAVPGLQAASNLLVNSLADGAANAFLTLRVGMMARSYCSSLVQPDRRQIRKSATIDALAMFSQIVQDNAAQIASAVWQRVGSTASGIANSAARGTKDAANATVEALSKALEVTGRQLKEFADAVARKAGRAPLRVESAADDMPPP